MQGESRERTAPVIGSMLRGQAQLAQHQAVALTARLRLDDPARELLEALLGLKSLDAVEVEDALLGA